MFEMEVGDALKSIPGFRSKSFFLSALRSYCGQASKIFPEQRQYWLDKMFETHEMLITAYQTEFALFAQEEPAGYWIVLTNHITLCQRLKKQERAEQLLKTFEEEADEHLLIYSQLNRFITHLDVHGALQYIDGNRIRSKFEQFRDKLTPSRQIVICYQCGFFYFIDKRWAEARRWFAKTLDGHRPDAHHIAVTLTGLLDILCAFELKAYGGPVRRLFVNFESRQRRAGQWNTLLKDLTELLKKHLSQHSDLDTREHLEPLREYLSQNQLLGTYGSVLAWLEARLNGTNYLTELKKYN